MTEKLIFEVELDVKSTLGAQKHEYFFIECSNYTHILEKKALIVLLSEYVRNITVEYL